MGQERGNDNGKDCLPLIDICGSVKNHLTASCQPCYVLFCYRSVILHSQFIGYFFSFCLLFLPTTSILFASIFNLHNPTTQADELRASMLGK